LKFEFDTHKTDLNVDLVTDQKGLIFLGQLKNIQNIKIEGNDFSNEL